MPRYYCDYCDAYLTHDSVVVRKQHNSGYKHKANVKAYYGQFEEAMHQMQIEAQIRARMLGQPIPGMPLAKPAGDAAMAPPVLPPPGMPPVLAPPPLHPPAGAPGQVPPPTMAPPPGMAPPLAAVPPVTGIEPQEQPLVGDPFEAPSSTD